MKTNFDVVRSRADFEILAKHYRLNSVWMGLHAFNEVKAGKMKWREWLPDGLHPEHRGSLSYAESVISLLNEKFAVDNKKHSTRKYQLPTAHNPDNWEHTTIFRANAPNCLGANTKIGMIGVVK